MSLEMTEKLFKEINEGTEYFVEWYPDEHGLWGRSLMGWYNEVL